MGLGEEIAAKIAMGIVRGWLNGYLKRLTPKQVHDAIEHNQDIWGVTPGEMQQQGRQWKGMWGKYYDTYYDRITTELIMQWMKEDHPPLWKEIMYYPNGIGYHWFDAQVYKIKEKIKNL